MRRAILLMLLSFTMISSNVTAKEMTAVQRDRADAITDICVEEWERYGVLPSTCIGQAFIESTLGEHCSGFNLWGIRSGAEQYGSIEAGVYRYLSVINNGCYKGAPFKTNPKEQIEYILDGGYCQPVGSYYSDFCRIIDDYNLTRYDKGVFKKIEQKEHERLRGQKFNVVYDKNLKPNEMVVNSQIIKGGAGEVYQKDVLIGIFDIKNDDNLKTNVIKIGIRPKYDRAKIKFHNAKG